jgi:hypothetical protein
MRCGFAFWLAAQFCQDDPDADDMFMERTEGRYAEQSPSAPYDVPPHNGDLGVAKRSPAFTR